MKFSVKLSNGCRVEMEYNETTTVLEIKKKVADLSGENFYTFSLVYGGRELKDDQYIKDYGIASASTLQQVLNTSGGGDAIRKEINLKFIIDPKNSNKSYFSIFNKFKSEEELYGLLKLCFLKEISLNIDLNKLAKLPKFISYILRLLKHGYIPIFDPYEEILQILKKNEGSNILNFSKFIDKTINSTHIKTILQYLDKDDYEKLNDIKKRLLNYNEYIKFFEKDFENRKRNSIFEFTIISMVIMEREDFQTFENQRKNCPNREDKILYHRTSIEPISCILTGYFKKSIERCYQHGKGVYFSDILDYNWFYGGEKSNRSNINKIPKVNDTFTLIACSTYYNKNGFKKVKDSKYTPKKNEINFAYAKYDTSTIADYPDKSKFYGTEYVIWDLN